MKGQRYHTIVIKLGTSSIVDETTHEPLLSILSQIVETAVKLRKDGHRVVIVSSGAIGVGLRRMNVDRRPKLLPHVQALAAIGQCRLISLWDSLFAHLQQPIAQILLTRNDIADRTQYLNAQNTITALLSMGVIPIVNENDTLAVTEIKFGDNDTLSAFTAAMVSADCLFLMTDVDCLYTTNPRTDPNAKPIEVVNDINELQVDTASAGSALGTGGMGTKLVAARLATSAGITTVITKSSKPGNIRAILKHLEAPEFTQPPEFPLHTRFVPSATPVRDRRLWVLHGLAPHGTIYIDDGAFKALSRKAGLLPVGIVDVEGQFAQQEAVRLVVVKRASQPIKTAPQKESGFSSGQSTPAIVGTDSGLGSGQSTPTIVGTDSELSTGQSTPTVIGTPATSQDGESNASNSPPDTPKAALALGGIGGYEASFNFDTPASSVYSLPSTGQSSLESSFHHNPDPIDRSVPPKEVGRAVVNYSSIEVSRIKGCQSSEIVKLLGYADSEYVAHRENVSLNSTSASKQPVRNMPAIQSIIG